MAIGVRERSFRGKYSSRGKSSSKVTGCGSGPDVLNGRTGVGLSILWASKAGGDSDVLFTMR